MTRATAFGSVLIETHQLADPRPQDVATPDDGSEPVRRRPADRNWPVTARDSRQSSNATGQEEDDENQQQQADASTRAVAPAPAVPPRRQRPEECEDQDDNQNRCKHQLPLREVLAVTRFAGTSEMAHSPGRCLT
jgi:hypothetical protein